MAWRISPVTLRNPFFGRSTKPPRQTASLMKPIHSDKELRHERYWAPLGGGAFRVCGSCRRLRVDRCLGAGATVPIDIPAQRLDRALTALAQQSGVPIQFADALAGQRTAQAVQGRMAVSDALERLLAGSGLRARSTGANAFTVEAQAQDVPAKAAADGSKAPAVAELEATVVSTDRTRSDLSGRPARSRRSATKS